MSVTVARVLVYHITRKQLHGRRDCSCCCTYRSGCRV
jgi:hypothetical protein